MQRTTVAEEVKGRTRHYTCRQCGADFERPIQGGRRPLYCGDACSRAGRDEQSKVAAQARRAAMSEGEKRQEYAKRRDYTIARYYANRPPLKEYPPRPCAFCGVEFTPRSGSGGDRAKYCGKRCAAAVENEREKERAKAKRAADPEKARNLARMQSLRDRRNNPERFRDYERRRRAKEEYRAYQKARKHQRRARLHGDNGTHTAADILALERLQTKRGESLPRCWWCGKKVSRAERHVDHRFALAVGGSNAPDNLCISCATCNVRKQTKTPWEFAGRLL